MKIILTAPPKTGKSTLLKKLQKRIPNMKGILTHEVLFKNKIRTGFEVEFLNSQIKEKLSIAEKHSIFQGNFSVGNYGVKTASIDFCAEYLETLTVPNVGNDIVIIDEIGRMQSCSEKYLDIVYGLLTKENLCVIASLVYEDEVFARRFRNIPGVQYIEVTIENRNTLENIIYKKYLEFQKPLINGFFFFHYPYDIIVSYGK